MAWNRSAPLTKRNQICSYAFLYREKVHVDQPHTFAHNLSALFHQKNLGVCAIEFETYYLLHEGNRNIF